jgi:ribosome-associated protein
MDKQDFERLSKEAANIASDKKAENISILDVSDLTTTAYFFLIIQAQSQPQINAICDEIEKSFKEQSIFPLRRESISSQNWRVIDYGGIIIHVMSEQTRLNYKLEDFWNKAKKVDFMPEGYSPDKDTMPIDDKKTILEKNEISSKEPPQEIMSAEGNFLKIKTEKTKSKETIKKSSKAKKIISKSKKTVKRNINKGKNTKIKNNKSAVNIKKTIKTKKPVIRKNKGAAKTSKTIAKKNKASIKIKKTAARKIKSSNKIKKTAVKKNKSSNKIKKVAIKKIKSASKNKKTTVKKTKNIRRKNK